MVFPRHVPTSVIAVVVMVGLIVATAGISATPATAADTPLVYEQDAYATSASVGGVTVSGPTFPAGVSCTTAPGLVRTSGGMVSIPGIITGGPTFQSVTTVGSDPDDAQVGVTRSTIISADILRGVVGLTNLVVTSTADDTGSGIDSTGAVSLGSLTVLGVPIPTGDIAPNTVVPIPLLGSITLNEQTVTSLGIRTVGMRVILTAGPNAGLDLVVGSTQSRFLPTPSVVMTGSAYSDLVAAGAVSGEPAATRDVPCHGGASTGRVVSINLPGVLTAGAVAVSGSSALGKPTLAVSRAEVGGVDILGGLIIADAIRSQVNATQSKGSPPTIDNTGTIFEGLVVAGVPIPAEVAPNTRIPLPGVGHVVLNRQIRTAGSLEVRAVEVAVEPAGSAGNGAGNDAGNDAGNGAAGALPAGSVIRVAVASVRAGDQSVPPALTHKLV